MLQYGRFEAAHRQQLEALDLPRCLWRPLYEKIAREVFDIGEWVVLSEAEPGNGGASGATGLARHRLCLSADRLDTSGNVFLVDHAWTTTAGQAAEELASIPGLSERMERLTGICEPRDGPAAAPGSEALCEAIETNVSVVMSQAGVDEGRARELLLGCQGDPVEAIMAAGDSAQGGDGAAGGAQASLQSQVLRQLEADGGGGSADGPTQWATRNYECVQYSIGSGGALDAIDIRLPLRPGVRSGDVKCTFAPQHIAISVAGAVVVDGDLHARIDVDESTWAIEDGTLCVSLVKREAERWPVALVGEQHIDPRAHQNHLQRVLRELWRYFQGYDYLTQHAGHTLAKRTNWYIQDEVGLAVAHSDSPNVRCFPFLYLDSTGAMTPFSVLWPIAPVLRGDMLLRDYCPRWLSDPAQRMGYLQAIFPGPPQFALDAWERLAEEWARAAGSAERADLATAPMPKSALRSLYVAGAGTEAKCAIEGAGFALASTADDADVVMDDAPHADKLCGHHNLFAVLHSASNAVTTFQRIAGVQSRLGQRFHLRTQISEFIGAALMARDSWWLLASEPDALGVQPPAVLTSSWVAAVRHVDVGYTAAVRCPPTTVIGGRLSMAERLVLLAPNNGVYLWAKGTRVYQHQVTTSDGKPLACQVLGAAAVLTEVGFTQQAASELGPGGFPRFAREADRIAVDAMRLLLGVKGDGVGFGLFAFRFAFGEDGHGGVAPVLLGVRPVLVHEQLALDPSLIPSVAAVLAGEPREEHWRLAEADEA
ncbi:hypothetical protein LPJ61_000713 [Coemansia biformis]|uniref:CS domain-containing protein n=1 Tax=Coemansia biformis TaxID=1286918 RepID=A0A9W7YHT4_9FUNG|nr:hypothetical protein LPJ61_000713 [Coemansia biformis]